MWIDFPFQQKEEKKQKVTKKYTVKPPKDLKSKFEQKMEARRLAEQKAEEDKRRAEEEQRLAVNIFFKISNATFLFMIKFKFFAHGRHFYFTLGIVIKHCHQFKPCPYSDLYLITKFSSILQTDSQPGIAFRC